MEKREGAIPTEGYSGTEIQLCDHRGKELAYLPSTMASPESAEPVINTSLATQIATSEGEALVDLTSVNTI
jgi:hypothetical protein